MDTDTKELIENAVNACGREADDIDQCIEVLRPHLEPYFKEGEFDERFVPSFHTMMKTRLPTRHFQATSFIAQLMSGPTYAEQRERIEKLQREQEAEAKAFIDLSEKHLVSVVLQRLGFVKGDKLVAFRDGLIYIDPTDFGIELPDADGGSEKKSDTDS